jgi:transcriptional regulator with XRE-family HTH domain
LWARGWSQNRLADAAGISRKHLAAFEAGENVTLVIVDKVAEALGLGSLTFEHAGGGIDVAALLDAAMRIVEDAERISDALIADRRRPAATPRPWPASPPK